jgi:hypothetical protein
MGRRCQPWVGQLLFLTVALAGTPSVVWADPVPLTSSMLQVNWDGNCAGMAIKDGGFRLNWLAVASRSIHEAPAWERWWPISK